MVGAHVCANHTPALTFDYYVAKPNEEGEHKIPEKFGRIPKEKQTGRLGQPEIFGKSPKHPHWGRTDQA